jgi:hypothetical protein
MRPLDASASHACDRRLEPSSTSLYNDIFGKRLEPRSGRLYDRNGNMSSLAGLDVSYGAGLAGVRATDDFTLGAISHLCLDL